MSSDALTTGSPSRLRQSRYNVVVTRSDRVWIYNSLSGSTLSVSGDDWLDAQRFLAGESVSAPPVEVLRDLTLGRMIVNGDLDELEVLERRFRTGTGDR